MDGLVYPFNICIKTTSSSKGFLKNFVDNIKSVLLVPRYYFSTQIHWILLDLEMAGAVGGAPNEPPPDYEYAINHPEDTVTMTPPDYRAAVNLPSYQEAMLDKGIIVT